MLGTPPFLAAADADAASPLAAANKMLLGGKYAEAADAYEFLLDEYPTTAAVGLARCHCNQGEYDQADEILRQALSAAGLEPGQRADLSAELAALAVERGDYAAADEHVAAALAAHPDHLQARWWQAELHRLRGRMDEANQACEWFVDYYNGHDDLSAEDHRWIGLGAAQFARWNKLHDQFKFLVNTLYTDALEIDPAYWWAPYEAGRLYLEKYNQAEARKDLETAVRLNPNAAEVYAALAALALQNYDLDDADRYLKRAREINPKLFDAYLYQADRHLANFETAEAVAELERARGQNPASELCLGRLAGALAVIDGVPDDPAGTRMGAIIDEAVARNPHCGEFFHALGSTFDLTRKYPAAARYYREAVERMPQLVAPRGALGLMYMRLGDEVEAQRLLDESFDVDPFNVRVSNSLKVLEVLENYAVVESEHFVIKFDRGQDEILVRYMLRYLEDEVYPELCRHFGFEPEGKSLFEVFNRARNTNGHGWFSARMVGLPYIGTVGACAGKIVALASPNDMPSKYNWARVVKHEFVHVLNLQQSRFNIPHWYTEALAVQSEGYPRPAVWNRLLAQRVPAGDLFNLENINLAFVRPKSSLDWQMAYCQANLYAQYMLDTYGADALAKMLNCYADNLDTRAALRRSFNVEQEDFEQGYQEYLKRIVAEMGEFAEESDQKMSELVRLRGEKPDDPDVAARLAQAYLARKDYPQARRLAEEVLAAHPRHQRATFVLASVRRVIGDDDAAKEMLAACLDRDAPDALVAELLGELYIRASAYDEAEDLYALMSRRQPMNLSWLKRLAAVYLRVGNVEKLEPVLADLALHDADDLVMRKKLCQMALARKDFDSAVRWGNEALWVDVMDLATHRMLAQAYTGQGNLERAAEEYDVAVQLDPKLSELRVAQVRAWMEAGQVAKARAALDELVRREPNHAELPALRELVQP